MARTRTATPRVSKITGRPVDPKRSRAAKKAAATRRANAAAASRKISLRLRHKLTAAGAIVAVLVLTFFGIRGQLDAYAATVSTGTLTNAAGLCLENANAKAVNDNNIRMYKCNGSAAQRWMFSDGSMKYAANTDYCFNVAGVNKKAVGAYIQLWKCNSKPEMKFSVHGTTLVNDPTGYCVTTKNGGTGSDQIIMKPCDGSSIQKFTFTATGTDAPVKATPPVKTPPSQAPVSGSGSPTTSPCGSKDPNVIECTSGDPADTTTGSDSSYDSDTDGNGSGVQQTGANLALWQNLKGDTFNARANAAGSSKIVSLPAGTFAFSDFRIGDQGVKKGMSAYGTRLSAKGIVGAGVGKTIIQMNPKTSTKAASQPASCGGGDGCPTNNLYLMAMTASGAKFDGITLKGTPQGHYYGGLLFARVSNPSLTNAKFTDIPGGSSANPDETFFVNFHRASGKATIKNVSIEGGSVGAAGIAMNTCSASFDIDNLNVDGLKYSAGIALWEQTGTINIRNWTNKNAPRALGAERLGGTVNIYDPNWAAPKKGHDITYTPYKGHQGRINFYFSSASKVPNRKIVILTNTSSVKSTVHVYIGGQEQDQGKYIGWKGI